MNFLHFATDDVRGGAAKLSYSLHTALLDRGHTSRLMVLRKYLYEARTVIALPVSPWRFRLEKLRRNVIKDRWLRPKVDPPFNFNAEPCVDRHALQRFPVEDVDVICVHWITGFLTTGMIQRLIKHYRKPVLWTMMDQEPVTGGCHYSGECLKYREGCGRCPQLGSSRNKDASYWLTRQKRALLENGKIAFWCGTESSAGKVRASFAFRDCPTYVIPAPVDETVFRPFDKSAARDLLHLPSNTKIMMFGTSMLDEPRKGFATLLQALELIRSSVQRDCLRDVHLLLVGSTNQVLPSIPLPFTRIGFLSDGISLALCYQASDVYVCASNDDEGPHMIAQGMMCGTPVIAFPTGLALDLVENNVTGILCERADAECLAEALVKFMSSTQCVMMEKLVHQKAYSRHSRDIFCESYVDACRELCQGTGAHG